MIYEGVNFNAPVVSSMTYEEFEKMHLGVFWTDRDEKTRKKMLSEVYGLCKSKKRTEK